MRVAPVAFVLVTAVGLALALRASNTDSISGFGKSTASAQPTSAPFPAVTATSLPTLSPVTSSATATALTADLQTPPLRLSTPTSTVPLTPVRAGKNDVVPPGGLVAGISGLLTYLYRDLETQDDGPGIVFARSYNSLDTRETSLGPGWRHNFDISLTDPGYGHGELALTGPQGRVDIHTRNPDGSFASRPGVPITLSRGPDGTLTAAHSDGTRWLFDTGGKLATIIDPAGNVTRLERDSQGRLIQISDPGGRGALHLTYDPATSRLTSISDWLNPPRVITFGYDSQNRLASVTDRNGEVTHYTYDGDGMHLSSIVDARGHEALAVTYDPISRVMRQCNAVTVQTGHCNTFEYKLGADGSFVQTIQESPTGYDPTWQPVLVNYYDSAGREVKSILSPTAKGDPVVTYFSFGVNATKASTTEQGGIVPPPLTPHSTVGLAEVAKLPRPPDVQPVRAIRAITAIGRQLPPTEVTRDPFGRVVQFVVGSSAATSVGIKAGTVQVAYDAEDRPTQLKIQPSGGGDTTTLGFDYDAVGNLVSATASGIQVARYKYDERDSMVLMQTAGGQTQTFTYDERGYLASEEVQDPDTSTDELVRWAYDGAGRLRRLEDYPQWPAKTAAKIVEYSYDGTHRTNAYILTP